MRSGEGRCQSHQDEIATKIVVLLVTPPSGLTAYLERAVATVFVLFGGMRFDPPVIEEIVNKVLWRR